MLVVRVNVVVFSFFSIFFLSVSLTFFGNTLGYIGAYYFCFFIFLSTTICTAFELSFFWNKLTIQNLELFNWLELGNSFNVVFNFEFTFFSLLLSQLVLSGSLFVLVFSYYDMWEDRESLSFVTNISYFVFFMLILINSGNLLTFYLGWEGIGFMSFFLISFYSERVRSVKAAIKVFVINKVGDFFLVIFLLLLSVNCNGFEFTHINAVAWKFQYEDSYFFSQTISTSNLLGLLLVLSSSVKSAQFGFHTWLIEAMEAPTGASALMHSSTLVIAGAILILKLPVILLLSNAAMNLTWLWGSVTALSASIAAMASMEIKAILANSTINNMGYLFILLGFLSNDNAILLILIHGYIKIYLFIIAGLIINFFLGNQDIRQSGSVIMQAPALWCSFLLGLICLMGLPTTAGYFVKLALFSEFSIANNPILHLYFFGFFSLSLLFSLIYPSLLVYSIFLGARQSNWKIYYFSRHLSPIFYYPIFIILFLILFLGVGLSTFVLSVNDWYYWLNCDLNFFTRLKSNAVLWYTSAALAYIWHFMFYMYFLLALAKMLQEEHATWGFYKFFFFKIVYGSVGFIALYTFYPFPISFMIYFNNSL